MDADEEQDFYITVEARIGHEDHYVPVELWGTGLLQITQLYSYVILFQPSVFLADEPDAHLHPSRQRLLASAFDDISENYGCQVIAATHSEHLISSRPESTKLIWMQEGTSVPHEDPDLTELLLHLGCLDEVSPNGDQILLLTEDKNHHYLTTAINELDEEGYRVKVIPVNGVSNLGIADTFVRLKEQIPNCTRIVIHRDRDFLTDDEIEGWLNLTFPTSTARPDVFVTRYCDMEAYYCSIDYILRLYQDEPNITDQYDRILRQYEDDARKEFAKKRKANNKENFLPEGGSPTNQSLWPDSEPVSLRTVVGKKFLKRLNDQLARQKIDIARIGSVAPEELLIDLRACFNAVPPSSSLDNAHDLI
ncbi:AAA family ATPase [Schaalia odontolytica]|uniref:AAA family ATPase n=1 Tax=Schaalia odontolytica TaxID=1660 RepID=UPI002481AFB3|nr:AAA family ATPase [Schaalia odontolytica]